MEESKHIIAETNYMIWASGLKKEQDVGTQNF